MNMLKQLAPFIGLICAWFYVAKYYKNRGFGKFIRHLAGFAVGFLVMVVAIINLVPSTAQPSNDKGTTNVSSVQSKPEPKKSEIRESITPMQSSIQTLMQTPPARELPKAVEEKSEQTKNVVMSLVTRISNIDHSNVPVEKAAPKKVRRETTETALPPHNTKPKKQTKTVTYLKDDGASPTSQCGSKRLCKQMSSCAEARFYLNQCGLDRLDRDGDGIPCESLCLGKKKRR